MSNAEQEEFWSTQAGHAWVELHLEMDTLMQPVLDLVLEHAALGAGARVLDIGCGTGASLLQAARHVGPTGHVTGLDISQTMLDLARSRVKDHANVVCVKADAQTHAFQARSHDALISRFGVMFFEDTTAAFANMVKALMPGAPLTFAAWGPAPQNPYFMKPAAIAAEILGPMDKVDRTQPGPFAFEDPERIIPMLHAAGLGDVSVAPVALHLIPPGTVQDAATIVSRIGAADRAIRHYKANATDKARIIAALADWLGGLETKRGVEIPALINLYQAKAP